VKSTLSIMAMSFLSSNDQLDSQAVCHDPTLHAKKRALTQEELLAAMARALC
jgi:hypothetical protein